jgi:predicted Zn-dependent peptidase
MKNALLRTALAAALVLPSAARTPSSAPAAPELKVERHMLENGMRVLFLRDPRSPTLATYLQFKVGSVDEQAGQTGMAHFFEHMVFKGSETLGTGDRASEKPLMERQHALYRELKAERARGEGADATKLAAMEKEWDGISEKLRALVVEEELWSQYLRNGGEHLNASTSPDTTQYHVSLPSNRLELWCWLESDRFLAPVFRDYYPERDVVMEERRMRTDNEPEGMLYESLFALMFMAHPYRWPTVGWMSDLENLDAADAETFFRTYYAPNNAVAVFVGDMDPEAALPLIRRYMERIPRQAPPRPVETVEPEQKGERRAEIHYPASPEVFIGWRVPDGLHPDMPAVEALITLLTEGRSSRLYRRLVEETGMASEVHAEIYPEISRYPAPFILAAKPGEGHGTEEIERVVYEELDRLAREGVEAWEMERLRNAAEARIARLRNSNMAMAGALAKYENLGGWERMTGAWKRSLALKGEDIQTVVKKYFQPHQRSVVTLVEKREDPSAGDGGE